MIEPFGWFATFAMLANDNVLKLKEVSKTQLYTALTFLSLSSAKAEFNNRLSEVKQ